MRANRKAAGFIDEQRTSTDTFTSQCLEVNKEWM